VAEHRERVAPRGIFTGTERAAEGRPHAEDVEQLRGHQRSLESHRFAAAGQVELIAASVDRDAHGPDLFAHRVERAARICAGDLHQTIRLRVGERTEQDRVDQAEDGDVRADAECQRDRGDHGVSGIAGERARRIADVLRDGLEDGNALAFDVVERPRNWIPHCHDLAISTPSCREKLTACRPEQASGTVVPPSHASGIMRATEQRHALLPT
jgi:hypothetical protein